VLVGTTCFLLVNATNPYLWKFDSYWVIFMPVALINAWLLSQQTENAGWQPSRSFDVQIANHTA